MEGRRGLRLSAPGRAPAGARDRVRGEQSRWTFVRATSHCSAVPAPSADAHPAPSSRPARRTVTELLHASNAGDAGALGELIPLVYEELRREAARHMRRQPLGHTLDPTAVAHEAYVRLVNRPPGTWEGRAHFFGVASKVMRSVLVDHARARRSAKRGGSGERLTLGAAAQVADAEPAVDVIDLDDALARLAAFDPERSRVVELRYFTGLSIEETADVLRVSPATVKRHWTVARAWLKRELGG